MRLLAKLYFFLWLSHAMFWVGGGIWDAGLPMTYSEFRTLIITSPTDIRHIELYSLTVYELLFQSKVANVKLADRSPNRFVVIPRQCSDEFSQLHRRVSVGNIDDGLPFLLANGFVVVPRLLCTVLTAESELLWRARPGLGQFAAIGNDHIFQFLIERSIPP